MDSNYYQLAWERLCTALHRQGVEAIVGPCSCDRCMELARWEEYHECCSSPRSLAAMSWEQKQDAEDMISEAYGVEDGGE